MLTCGETIYACSIAVAGTYLLSLATAKEALVLTSKGETYVQYCFHDPTAILYFSRANGLYNGRGGEGRIYIPLGFTLQHACFNAADTPVLVVHIPK